MKIFISWSGDKSQKIAIALQEWLQKVIQSVVPFVSKEDISKGDVWINAIENELTTSDYGIVCVTPENRTSAWLMFEAGALANKVGKAHMTPFLTEISSSELDRPLSLYQTTEFNKDDILKLLKTINSKVEQHLAESTLQSCFDMWWPELETSINNILSEDKEKVLPAQSKKKKTEDILEEHGRMLQDIKTFLITYQAQSTRKPSRSAVIGRDYIRKITYWNDQLLQEIEEIKQLTNPTYRAYARLDNLTDLARKERELMEAIARTILDDGLAMLH